MTTMRAAARVVWAGVTVLALGTAGYVVIEHVSVFEALYMTVITISTIGFSEVFPLSVAGRAFTMVLAFSGVGIMLYAVSTVAAIVVETDLRKILGLRREHRVIKRMTGHIVVCGAGRMGRGVVEILRHREVGMVVVERDPECCRGLEGESIPVVQGDATQSDVLLEAGIDRAVTMISSLAEDAHNVYAVLLARQLNPAITIIARAVEEGAEERLRLAGANTVMNPYRIGSMRIAYTALKPTVIDFLDASLPGTDQELELAEVSVRDGAELVGKSLAGAQVRTRFGVIVVALRRGGTSLFNPSPNSQIEAGDVLVALGPVQAIEGLEGACE
jgi:voltage-gated potassium channel